MAGSKAGPPAARMVANQLCLCFGMRDADIVIGQQIGAPEQFGFMRPVGAEASNSRPNAGCVQVAGWTPLVIARIG